MSASVLRTKNGLKAALVPIALNRVGTAEEIAGPFCSPLPTWQPLSPVK